MARMHTPLRSLAAAALIALAGASAAAQVRSQAPGPIRDHGGVRAEFPMTRPLGPVTTAPFPGSAVPRPSVIIRQPSGRHPVVIPVQRHRDSGGHSRGGFDRGFHHHPGVITSGSGISVRGSFGDDNFRVRFRVGSPFETHRRGHGHHGHHGHHHGAIFNPPFFHTSIPWWYDYDRGNRYTQIYGFYGPADPNLYTVAPAPAAPAVTEQPTPSTDKELGETYLAAGYPEVAVKALRQWLAAHAGDVDAMRLLGVALIESGQLQEGASMVAMAYRTDPSLAARPLDSRLFRSREQLREAVRRASIFANRVNSASAWLTVAVLMQAEGRDATARSMIEKARKAGLEQAVAQRFLG